jgi:hypothetical protein
MTFATKRHCGPEVPGSLKYTAYDVSESGSTSSSDEGKEGYTSNKDTLATRRAYWQQEGHTGNKYVTVVTRRAYWKQEWYIGNIEGILAIITINWQQECYTATRRAYW